MRRLLASAIVVMLVAVSLLGQDPLCPAYPAPLRAVIAANRDLQQKGLLFASRVRQVNDFVPPPVARLNFIDDQVFGKMERDGVQPAGPATDEEILRRMYLDLTGHIPSPEVVTAFVANGDPDKRSKLVDALMASDPFVDYWTFLYGNHFEVTSRYYNYVGIPGRNLFHQYLRDFIARDRSYQEVATEMITAAGDSHESAPANFVARAYQQGDPIQDTYDALTDRITRKFLGVQTQCISCHNGARHLEEINLYLTARKREEFWKQSAFVARTSITVRPVDAFFQQTPIILTDRLAGGYNSAVSATNPGARPKRTGGPYDAEYLFNGQAPTSENWRAELARMITADRQFARAAVNYIWAHFFKYGIVDPPDGWDLSRIDPKNPPPAPWTLQPSNPELLEALADEFIASNYSVRRIIRLIAQSSAYQLSSRYAGEWRPEYELYFAKHFPRRLYAEEIYDALTTATNTIVPMYVEGFDNPLLYATQLPDPSEPRNNFTITNFLSTFGRGDWWQVPRTTTSNTLQVLFQMNDNSINFRTFGNRNVTTRVTQLLETATNDQAAVNELFLATLGRNATQEEFALLLTKKTTNYEQWLSDIQWVLLNKIEFVFSN